MNPWEVDWSQPWFNGSDQLFDRLRPGSTITQWRALSEAFAHQPVLLWINDDGSIGHTGQADGFLYVIDEPLGPDDLEPVPGSTMAPGLEWHTRRPLRVRLITELPRPQADVDLPEPVRRFLEQQSSSTKRSP
jgi:hypothetical protein